MRVVGGLLGVKPQATLCSAKEAPEELLAPGASASSCQLVGQSGRRRLGEVCCESKKLTAVEQHMMVSGLLHRHWDVTAVFLAGKEVSLALLCLLSPCCCYHSRFLKHFSPVSPCDALNLHTCQ